MWRKIETYPLPRKIFDYDQPKILLYSKQTGGVVGLCVKVDDEPEEYNFQYDRDGLEITPTHWMPIPELPENEIEPVKVDSIRELLDTGHREAVLKICLEYSAGLNWRRDSLRWYIRDHNLDISFQMAELKEIIKEFVKE